MNVAPDLGERALAAVAVRAATLILVVAIASLTSCQMHADYQAAQALAKGADPVGVACALDKSAGSVCALAAARGVQ